MKQIDSAGTNSGQKGRKWSILCLVLFFYPLVVTAALAVIFGLTGTSTIPAWMVYFWFCCPIIAVSAVIGGFFRSPIALFGVMTALALLPLAGWFLANAGKKSGFLMIRICKILELLSWTITLILSFMEFFLAPTLLIAAALGLLIPMLTLFTLRAWQKSSEK